ASFPYLLVEDAPVSAGAHAGLSSRPGAPESEMGAGEERPGQVAEPAGPHGELLLIIEDNPDMRAFLRQELEQTYEILEASEGEAGLARAFETIPDLILTDVMMPGMDGHTVVRRLREDSRTSHIPIVMLTARASTENRIEGLESGVDEYLPKPFSSRLLQTRIRNLLDLRRLLRERYATETWIRPSDVEATDVDRAFLERLVEVVEERLSDPEFSVPELASAVHLSTSQLTRKLKALVDQTPGSLIRGMRLHRAADLLRQHAGSVAEIAYRTGFADQAHFSRAFKAMYGRSPSKYRG
ncbi:MAG TPA: response regulator, partial [Longimicrobiales bacterium]|nr:response regulator [Longimicrobiales bacterium]